MMNHTRRVKQVIVVRTDLAMDKGKAFSQVAHASMKFLADKIRLSMTDPSVEAVSIDLNEPERIWLEGKFTKIVLGVANEADLLAIKKNCDEKGIVASLIVDDGTTVFDGVATATCLGIGPDFTETIDSVTGHLKLYR